MSRDNSTRLRLCELKLARAECYKRILKKRAENTEMSERMAENDRFIAMQQHLQVEIDQEVNALEMDALKERLTKIREGLE